MIIFDWFSTAILLTFYRSLITSPINKWIWLEFQNLYMGHYIRMNLYFHIMSTCIIHETHFCVIFHKCYANMYSFISVGSGWRYEDNTPVCNLTWPIQHMAYQTTLYQMRLAQVYLKYGLPRPWYVTKLAISRLHVCWTASKQPTRYISQTTYMGGLSSLNLCVGNKTALYLKTRYIARPSRTSPQSSP